MEQTQPPEPGHDPEAPGTPKKPISEKQLEANRKNALLSTGAKTEEGKKISSRNRTTHGYFTVKPLLPGESEEDYDKYHDSFMREFDPFGTLELHYAEQFIGDGWRLMRILNYELEVFQETRYRDDLGKELTRNSMLEQRLKNSMARSRRELEDLQLQRLGGKRIAVALGDMESPARAHPHKPLWHPTLNNPEGKHYPVRNKQRGNLPERLDEYTVDPVVPQTAFDDQGEYEPPIQPVPRDPDEPPRQLPEYPERPYVRGELGKAFKRQRQEEQADADAENWKRKLGEHGLIWDEEEGRGIPLQAYHAKRRKNPNNPLLPPGNTPEGGSDPTP